MKTEIRCQGFELTDAIRAHVENQLQMNMANFGSRIISVSVSLSDINGPRGGADKKVAIIVHLVSRLTVKVERVRSDLYVAATQASRQARRTVRRTLNRHQRMEKQSLRDLPVSVAD